MKTLTTTALLAVLVLTGFGRTAEPAKTATEPAQPAVKKYTIEEVQAVLAGMGYDPQPVKDDNGNVYRYMFAVDRGSYRITIACNLSTDRTRVWMNAGITAFDDKYPVTPALLLGLLAKHNQLWPAYVTCNAAGTYMGLAMPMEFTTFGPAAVRQNLEKMQDKAVMVMELIEKFRAEEKAKAGNAGLKPKS